MTALAIEQSSRWRAVLRSPAVPLLQAFAFSAMVFPADTVIKAVGAGGYAGGIFAYLMFVAYAGSVLFGLHNPLDHRSPVRIGLCILWLSCLVSYTLMDRTLLSSAQQSSATRWLIQLLGISGVILVASEFLRSKEDLHKVLRALVLGGAIAGLIGALQYWLRLDLTPDLRHIMVGFKLNQGGTIAIGSRSGLNRVAGTATDPIEMGVAAAMLLPLAVYLAMHDKDRSALWRWLPVVFITLIIPITISRSAILGATLILVVVIVTLPPAPRVAVMAAIPVALVGIFLTAHRLIGTLTEYFTLGTGDNSISHRVNNYPYVFHLVSLRPWFGQGGGTYIADGSVVDLGAGHILDNQYLDGAIELGVIGVVALTFFLFWPVVAAFFARSRTADTGMRQLSAALGASALAGMVCSATFDSFGFPMFIMIESLVIGLIGAVWLKVDRETARRLPRLSQEG